MFVVDPISSVTKALVCFFSLAIAAYALIGYTMKPLGALVEPQMRADFTAHPVGVYVHVFSAAAALLLGPAQFSAPLRRARPSLHRWMGRLYLGLGVLVGGISGLYISCFAFGGLAARLGFAGLAAAWLFTGWKAYSAIRKGGVAAHRRWMVRNFSLAFAAVMLRIYIPAAVISGADFASAYPVIAWLCWLPNLLAAEWIIKSSDQNGAPSAPPI